VTGDDQTGGDEGHAGDTLLREYQTAACKTHPPPTIPGPRLDRIANDTQPGFPRSPVRVRIRDGGIYDHLGQMVTTGSIL